VLESRVLKLAVPLAVGALALTACGGGSKGGTTAGSKPTYTIAYEGPLSGGNQQLGLNMKFAVQLAINQANAGTTFGTLPFKLAFTSEDDQGSATASPAAAQALIQNTSVVAVVGPAFSGATKAAEPYFSAANLATVSPSATAPGLAQSGWTNFFRVVADDNSQGPADATYVKKVLHGTSVYSIDDASSYAAGLAGTFDSAAQADGIAVTHKTVPGTTQCQAGTGNVQEYSAVAITVKTANPSAVFYAGYYCDFALLAKALRSAGYTGQLVSDDGSDDPHYVSQAGVSIATGTVISCACQETINSAGYQAFAPQFQALAGFAPGTYSAESYDATNAILSVMKGLGASVTRAAIVAGLHASGFSYAGISKTVQFQADGNYGGSAVYMYKVGSDGKINELGLISTLAG